MSSRLDVAAFLTRLVVAELDLYLWIRLAEDTRGTIVISFHLAERDPWT